MRPKPCNDCKAPVFIVRKADGSVRSRWVVLDTDLLDPNRQHDGHRVRVIDNGNAYTLDHAREHLRMQTQVLYRAGDATDIEDLPWHLTHDCPNRKDHHR